MVLWDPFVPITRDSLTEANIIVKNNRGKTLQFLRSPAGKIQDVATTTQQRLPALLLTRGSWSSEKW